MFVFPIYPIYSLFYQLVSVLSYDSKFPENYVTSLVKIHRTKPRKMHNSVGHFLYYMCVYFTLSMQF